ncbi:MAG: hypothetical protein AB1488_11435 [Nitrospirota bacterium]
MSNEIAYSIVRRAVADVSFLQSLVSNPDVVIQNEGINDPNEIFQLKQVLLPLINAVIQTSEINTLLTNQLKTTMETADKFKSGLRNTVEQIDKGFRSTMMMYKVAFYLGVGLIVFSVGLAIFKGESLLPIVFGGLGIADVIAYFITKPPQDLQSSRANLAQLQAAFFNWFIDAYNWNSYLGDLGRKGTANFQNIKEVSTTLLENTNKTMESIEKYCELAK